MSCLLRAVHACKVQLPQAAAMLAGEGGQLQSPGIGGAPQRQASYRWRVLARHSYVLMGAVVGGCNGALAGRGH